jgi:hypothetical protein
MRHGLERHGPGLCTSALDHVTEFLVRLTQCIVPFVLHYPQIQLDLHETLQD